MIGPVGHLEGFGQRVSARRRASDLGLEMVVDNFAGAGGASLGIEAALGCAVDVAINHSRLALQGHEANHPATRHLCGDIWDYQPAEVTKGRQVGLMWASPDCKHFSKAKGGRPVSPRVRGLAWVVIRWAKEVKPRVIILENVEEFQGWCPLVRATGPDGAPLADAEGRPVMLPDKSRKGETFRRWVGQLRKLGYQVEWRELVAADYGVPTIRKRLFVVARCDGRPIVWPAPTHARRDKAARLGLRPWRAAAECIDWDRPCPSIFERKRPLAEATLRRIAAGLRRFVIDAAEPFVVVCNHGGSEARVRSVAEPLATVTASRDATGLVAPTLVQTGYGERDGQAPRSPGLEKPLGTVVAGGGKHALVGAVLSGVGGRAGQIPPRSPGSPLQTVTAKADTAVVTAFLAGAGGPIYAGKPASVEPPMGVVTAENHRAVVSAFLAKFRGDSRGVDAGDPMPTITSGAGSARPAGAAHALGAVMVSVQNASSAGIHDAGAPQPTITAHPKGGGHALAAAHLVKLRGTCRDGQAVDEPAPTVTAVGMHVGEVRAFLVAYYGSGSGKGGRPVQQPCDTITAKHRLGLVTVAGVEYQIADIGLRMLTPRELLRAQFGRFAADYVLVGSQAQQVAGIGNSVCPELAELLVRANVKLRRVA